MLIDEARLEHAVVHNDGRDGREHGHDEKDEHVQRPQRRLARCSRPAGALADSDGAARLDRRAPVTADQPPQRPHDAVHQRRGRRLGRLRCLLACLGRLRRRIDGRARWRLRRGGAVLGVRARAAGRDRHKRPAVEEPVPRVSAAHRGVCTHLLGPCSVSTPPFWLIITNWSRTGYAAAPMIAPLSMWKIKFMCVLTTRLLLPCAACEKPQSGRMKGRNAVGLLSAGRSRKTPTRQLYVASPLTTRSKKAKMGGVMSMVQLKNCSVPNEKPSGRPVSRQMGAAVHPPASSRHSIGASSPWL
eukprot:Unigene12223_Nuclearia_a/m.37142 Unigene12223_Nuclearia_a/g.37142  ORF Unigene12223_Nuclearia_a/g.37142 Unigene12223_Nuclearia_a/m.37142 type:complete len:301 (-) Unigene12223_Nuclearia_a:40-942(-)